MSEMSLKSASALFGRRMSLISRMGVGALLLAGEKFLLSFLVDSYAGLTATGLGKYAWTAQHLGLRFLVTFAITLALVIYTQGNERLKAVNAEVADIPWRPAWLVVHAGLLGPLAVLTYSFYGGHGLQWPAALTATAWLTCALASGLALLAAIAPWRIWREAVAAVGILWLYATVAGAAAACTIAWSATLWAPTTRITFSLVEDVLRPMIPTLHTFPETQVLDTGRFAVQVTELCSGLEGAGLMLAFCCIWLLYFRREYYFPRALIIIPIGLALLFVLNIARIAALVLIGDAGYPDIAMFGFHSQAGWIAFNCTAGGLAFLSRRSTWLSRSAHHVAQKTGQNPTASYLLPFLTILAVGMLSRAASGQFEVLYPLRLMAAVAAICYCWPKLHALNFRFTWRGPAIGIAVFGLWLFAAQLLAHSSPMPPQLAAMPPLARWIWVASRATAAVVTVPIAEELAYRGFLMRRIKDWDFEAVRFDKVGLWALLISSIAFGLGHGSFWLPGTVAGLLYGFVLMRTGRIGEAIAAHGTTNLLIAVWVLGLQQWQLW